MATDLNKPTAAQYEEMICDAISTIVDKKIETASFDKTIQATIIECTDASIGKYKCKYQDSSFYAFATSAEVTYINNALVYVLFPGNDSSKDKTILGAVNKLGLNYANPTMDVDKYDIIGTNCIIGSPVFKISSYAQYNSPSTKTKTSYVEILYKNGNKNNRLNINNTIATRYIKQSSSISISARFKTKLDNLQKFKGNYGIIFGLAFADNITGKDNIKYYTLDVDNMEGNPYNFTGGSKQTIFYDIDASNFKYIDSIAIFTQDFPNRKGNIQERDKDIEISEIELFGSNIFTTEELNGCAISFYTPQGTYFDNSENANESLQITAQVKLKGKLVDANAQKIPFYWFMEDLLITPNSDRYNKYGGRGWRCLNSYTVVQNATNSSPMIVNWIPAQDTFTIEEINSLAKETRYKCVVVYEDCIYDKNITITNLNNNYDVTIESLAGHTDFYYDVGNPTIAATVMNNNKDITDEVYFIWGKEDENKNYFSLPENVDENKTNVDNAIKYEKTYNEYLTKLEKGLIYPNALNSNGEYLDAKKQVEYYKTVEMIPYNNTGYFGNKILNVSIRSISSFMKYKCAAYSKKTGAFLGSAAITLSNSNELKNNYSLVINNGNQIFKYNEYGVSPTNKNIAGDTSIPSLSFDVYNNYGEPLSEEILKQCKIIWKVPNPKYNETLFQGYSLDSNLSDGGAPDAKQQYLFFKNSLNLGYSISNKYYYDKKDNDIELTVVYKDTTLIAKTNITFIKEGEIGTNGSEYMCKIVPNISSDFNEYPVFTIIENANIGTFNFGNFALGSGRTAAPFKLQLYKSEKLLYNGVTNGYAVDESQNIQITLKWEILKNKYKNNKEDDTYFSIDENSGRMSFDHSKKTLRQSANILKCTVFYDKEDGKGRQSIVATLPILYAIVSNANYKIKLKKNTGFLSVQYTADGLMPKYDDTAPFEIIVEKFFNNHWEDISVSKGFSDTHGIAYYSWDWWGRIYNYSKQAFEYQENCVLIEDDGAESNKATYKPREKYDGYCVNNAVQVFACDANDNILANLYIPVHFYLNKYGHAELNGWDGNSIQFNDEGGFILSPEMGAGFKEEDNSFTGVLMGKVQEPNRRSADVGLLGYKAGLRTFMVDSETGGAIFGKNNGGKLVIDPSSSKALLYSDNYWKNTNEKGFPSNYNNSNVNNQGMLIDLSTPRIHFGSGNFEVNSAGHITAKGGGSIAGWNIDNDSLFTGTKDSSSNVRISKADFNRRINGADRSSLRMAFGQKFAVSSDGTMYAGDAVIGTGTNKITIGKSLGNSAYSAIYSGEKTSFSAQKNGFYIGTDGIALGYNANNGGNQFEVNNSGSLIARSGSIGGWNFNNGKMYATADNGKVAAVQAPRNGVTFVFAAGGTSHNSYADCPFRVDKDGNVTATSGKVGGWTLASDKLKNSNGDIYIGTGGIKYKNAFTVSSAGKLTCTGADINGKITATSGTIGGWNINANSLTGGSVTLSKSGELSGKNWSITAAGQATFSNVNITGGSVNGNTLTGGSVSNGALAGGITEGKFASSVTSWVNRLVAKEIETTKIKIDQLATSSGDYLRAGWYQTFYVIGVAPVCTQDSQKVITSVKANKTLGVVTSITTSTKTLNYTTSCGILTLLKKATFLRGAEADA